MSSVNSQEIQNISGNNITAFLPPKKLEWLKDIAKKKQWWFNIEKPKISRRKVEKKLGEWRSACDAWPFWLVVNVSLVP